MVSRNRFFAMVGAASVVLSAFLGAPAAATTAREFVVYFSSDSADMNDPGKISCDRIVAYAKDSSNGITQAVITGHTDTAEAHADQLSLVRAEIVAKCLRDGGVPSTISFNVKGVGAGDPAVPHASSPINSRVIIDLN
jgi:outer membrane protein OmpA-like peptidoglycan-associated protein